MVYHPDLIELFDIKPSHFNFFIRDLLLSLVKLKSHAIKFAWPDIFDYKNVLQETAKHDLRFDRSERLQNDSTFVEATLKIKELVLFEFCENVCSDQGLIVTALQSIQQDILFTLSCGRDKK